MMAFACRVGAMGSGTIGGPPCVRQCLLQRNLCPMCWAIFVSATSANTLRTKTCTEALYEMSIQQALLTVVVLLLVMAVVVPLRMLLFLLLLLVL